MNSSPRAPSFNNIAILIIFLISSLRVEAFTISFDNNDFSVSTVFNSVAEFSFEIDIDGELASGSYTDPMINSVNYAVSGVLSIPTPSTFDAFALERAIENVDFYAQGSSLWFEVSDTANLSDGLQADELVPNSEGEVFIFNGREIENGRFHPALLVLNSDGSGRIQNSNNVPSATIGEIDFGVEYVTDLTFGSGNLTLVSQERRDSGGGAIEPWFILLGLCCIGYRRRKMPA